MATQQFITMSKAQVEEVIAKSSRQEGEQIRKMLQHSCSMYDLSGNHLPHPFEKENLLEVIKQRDTYIVDTNSTWKKECKDFPGKAFIITPALSREQQNTEELILSEKRNKLGNIFSIGLILSQVHPPAYVLIDKVDEHWENNFDAGKLRQASGGRGPIVAQQKIDHQKQVSKEREMTRFAVGLELIFAANLHVTVPISLKFLETGKASDLPPAETLSYTINRYKGSIKRRFPLCRYNVDNSKVVVEMCHQMLLLEDYRIRAEFDDPAKENVFGDMHILWGAIYLGASILTHDIRLTKMAGYAGIKCHHVPQVIKQPPKTS